MSAKMLDKYDEAEVSVRIVLMFHPHASYFNSPYCTIKIHKDSLATILRVCKYLLTINHVLSTWTSRKLTVEL